VTSPEQPKRYRIEESDLAEADREAAFLWQMSLHGPEYADRWHRGPLDVIQQIGDFPGPLSHPIVREGTETQREVRRALYYGPGHRRSRSTTRYRILFIVITAENNDEGVVRVLRIVHGAREEFGEGNNI